MLKVFYSFRFLEKQINCCNLFDYFITIFIITLLLLLFEKEEEEKQQRRQYYIQQNEQTRVLPSRGLLL